MSSPDPRFRPLRALLSDQVPTDPTQPAAHAQAAVSLVLRSRDQLELLLIRRAESPSDPWSGHMALPGGKREEKDETLLHTAVRETQEETGLILEADAQYLGRLSRLDPSTRRLPPLTITPYVFGVPSHAEATAHSHEVDEVFWVKLPTLRSPTSATTFRYDGGDLIRRFPAFSVQDQVVWGLTYRVLSEFLARTEAL